MQSKATKDGKKTQNAFLDLAHEKIPPQQFVTERSLTVFFAKDAIGGLKDVYIYDIINLSGPADWSFFPSKFCGKSEKKPIENGDKEWAEESKK